MIETVPQWLQERGKGKRERDVSQSQATKCLGQGQFPRLFNNLSAFAVRVYLLSMYAYFGSCPYDVQQHKCASEFCQANCTACALHRLIATTGRGCFTIFSLDPPDMSVDPAAMCDVAMALMNSSRVTLPLYGLSRRNRVQPRRFTSSAGSVRGGRPTTRDVLQHVLKPCVESHNR